MSEARIEGMAEGGEASTPGPQGGPYDWYTRGMTLLAAGDAAAAAVLLSHAVSAEPSSRSTAEALARAQFDAGDYRRAAEGFARLAEADPADDYAQFGAGVSAARSGDDDRAVSHLALAAALRPDNTRYRAELRGARARRGALRADPA